MDKRIDIAERIKQLAERLLRSEDKADLDSLKAEHMGIYEDLILLGLDQEESVPVEEEKPIPPDEAPEEKIGLDQDSQEGKKEPEPLTEQDDLVNKQEEFVQESILAEEHQDIPPEKEELMGENEKPEPEKEEYPTLSDLFVPTFNDIKEDMSQKEEFKDTVSLDETEKLFETRKEEIRQLSLNDRLVGNSIQIGLNDRIAFVNKLFNFSQSDFNKVLSRLNACNSRQEALHYVEYQVKRNYNWKGKEDLEERFIQLIERKFMT